MLSVFLKDLKEALSSTKREFAFLSLLAGLILLSYSMARGPSEALFLEHHSKEMLPGLWIEMGLGALCLVTVYNRLLNHFSLYSLFHISFWTSAVLFSILLSGVIPLSEGQFTLLGFNFPIGPITLLRIWCDLYIVLLVETFWSLANLHFSFKSATMIYGLLGVAGSLGSMSGNFIAQFSEDIGTINVIRLAIPCLMCMSLALLPLKGALGWKTEMKASSKERASLFKGIAVVARSKFLPLILILVLLSQVAVNLIDYQYKGLLKSLYTDLDARTAVNALVYQSIDIGSIVMQLLTGVTLSTLGVGGTLTLIPFTLMFFAAGALFSPVFWVIAFAKSAGKFTTYSIFKSAKELVYLPLTYAEQTQGKAVIDILIYRQAKLFTSVMLLLLASQQISDASIQVLTLIVILTWLFVSVVLWKKLKKHGGEKLNKTIIEID